MASRRTAPAMATAEWPPSSPESTTGNPSLLSARFVADQDQQPVRSSILSGAPSFAASQRRVSPVAPEERRETVAEIVFSCLAQFCQYGLDKGPASIVASEARSPLAMWYVYFPRLRNADVYVGSTRDLRSRFASHVKGRVLSTMRHLPATLLSYVAVRDEITARILERYFKPGSGKAFANKRFWLTHSEAKPFGNRPELRTNRSRRRAHIAGISPRLCRGRIGQRDSATHLRSFDVCFAMEHRQAWKTRGNSRCPDTKTGGKATRLDCSRV
jgi:predicted GIY-YIG superfamily endonuclease